MAAMYGRFTGSQILIQNGKKLLEISTQHGNLEVVSLTGVFFVFHTGGEIDSVDMYGNTPLHAAARYGQELLISTLLTNGADKARYVPHIRIFSI